MKKMSMRLYLWVLILLLVGCSSENDFTLQLENNQDLDLDTIRYINNTNGKSSVANIRLPPTNKAINAKAGQICGIYSDFNRQVSMWRMDLATRKFQEASLAITEYFNASNSVVLTNDGTCISHLFLEDSKEYRLITWPEQSGISLITLEIPRQKLKYQTYYRFAIQDLNYDYVNNSVIIFSSKHYGIYNLDEKSNAITFTSVTGKTDNGPNYGVMKFSGFESFGILSGDKKYLFALARVVDEGISGHSSFVKIDAATGEFLQYYFPIYLPYQRKEYDLLSMIEISDDGLISFLIKEDDGLSGHDKEHLIATVNINEKANENSEEVAQEFSTTSYEESLTLPNTIKIGIVNKGNKKNIFSKVNNGKGTKILKIVKKGMIEPIYNTEYIEENIADIIHVIKQGAEKSVNHDQFYYAAIRFSMYEKEGRGSIKTEHVLSYFNQLKAHNKQIPVFDKTDDRAVDAEAWTLFKNSCHAYVGKISDANKKDKQLVKCYLSVKS